MAVYSMTGYASATAGATSAHLGEAQTEVSGAKSLAAAAPQVGSGIVSNILWAYLERKSVSLPPKCWRSAPCAATA